MEYGNPSVLAAIIGGCDHDQGEIVEQVKISKGKPILDTRLVILLLKIALLREAVKKTH